MNQLKKSTSMEMNKLNWMKPLLNKPIMLKKPSKKEKMPRPHKEPLKKLPIPHKKLKKLMKSKIPLKPLKKMKMKMLLMNLSIP